MRHLDEGTLRRLYDEPRAVAQHAQEHVAACARCRERFAAIAADARSAAASFAMLETAGTEQVDVEQALAAVRRRIAAQAAPAPAWREHRLQERIMVMIRTLSTGAPTGRPNRRLLSPLSGIVAAVALVAALALTPVGSLAQSFLTIFEPQQFVAVDVTPADITSLNSLPNLTDFGTMTRSGRTQAQMVAGATEAASVSGLTVRTPGWLPAGVPAQARYAALPAQTGTFTFSAARAAAAARATGKALPAMPATLDGSELRVTLGPVVVAAYGEGDGNGQKSVKGAGVSRADLAALPALVVVQARRPTMESTGASVADIESYLLAMPGISPALAAQIKAIGDPASTVPVPIPLNMATANTVSVDGVSGLAVGDNTGMGSGVIWQKDGMVYGVAGPLPIDQVLAVANSLR
jgi:hypothetical protein